MDFFRRRLILIADDNHDLAFTLSVLLKLIGFDVDTVHNGKDARDQRQGAEGPISFSSTSGFPV